MLNTHVMRNQVNYSEAQMSEAQAIVDANVVENGKSVYYVTLGQSGNSLDVRFVLYRLNLKCESAHVNPFQFHCILGDDLIEACRKAKSICGTTPIVIDFNRQNAIAEYHKWTPDVVRFGKNYGLKLEECEPKFVVWVAKGCPLYDQEYDCWCNHYYGGEAFMHVAREFAIKNNLGLVAEDRFYTHEQYAKMMAKKEALESLKQGHHYPEGTKIIAKMTIVKMTGYNSDYGYVSIITMSDEENRAFTYKGTSFPISVSVGDIIQIKGTIKHGEYKETKQSFVQRVKVLN
jgi:hypothetical protein